MSARRMHASAAWALLMNVLWTGNGLAQAAPQAAPQAEVQVAPPQDATAPVEAPAAPPPTPAAAPAAAAPEPVPSAPAEPSPSPAAPDADAEAMLAQLDAETSAEASDGGQAPVQIYGFADIGYRHLFVDDDNPWLLFLNRYPSIFVGNLNVYLDGQLADRWRALFEIRFTYLPHGAPRTDFEDDIIERESTRTADYNDFTRSKALGSIVIERAMVEYAPFAFLSFKAGQWLTPYGIWNVDHGSPVIIGVSRPFIIGSELLPEHQVGLMADGGVPIGGAVELGYMLALSNGRIDDVPYEDLDSGKAVTARGSLTHRGLGELTLGSTFFTGRSTTAVNQLFFENGSPKSRQLISSQFDEVSYAFDLRWVYEGVHVQTEWIINDRRYTEQGRPPGPNGGLRPDKRNWGGYGLLGYRLPWFPLMPYAKAEYSPEPQSQEIGVADQIMILTGGLNYRPLPAVVLKAEYVYGHFTNGDPKGFAGNDIHGLDLQLSCSF